MENSQDFHFEFHAFFEKTPDLVCIAGKDGFFKKVNRAVIDKLEYTENELMTRGIESFIYSEDKAYTMHKRAELLNGKVLINFQNRYVSKSGKILWLEWTSIYFPDDEIVFAIAKDITEKKQVEKEVEEKYKKFKSLATHFKSNMEEDRKYLANELHEELAQLVSVLKLDVDWISNNVPELSESLQQRIDHVLVICDLLVSGIRRISFSISPAMLEELGLNEAMEWLCKEFSILNGISCGYEGSYNETHLTHEIKLDFFRICQESLTNVTYHAQAKNVKISIEDIGEKICLTVVDDGKGFDITQQKRPGGLIRMRERAASINGHLTIESKIGEGTRVCVVVAKI